MSAAYKEPESAPLDTLNGTDINGARGVSPIWAAWLKRIQAMNRPEVRARIAGHVLKAFQTVFHSERN